jgi:hypothetical protein
LSLLPSAVLFNRPRQWAFSCSTSNIVARRVLGDTSHKLFSWQQFGAILRATEFGGERQIGGFAAERKAACERLVA